MGISQEDIFWENEDGSLLETSVMVDSGDMSKNMLKRIHQYFDKRIESSREERARYWEVDFSDLTRLEKSVEKNRKELSRILGIVDSVVPEVNMEYVSGVYAPAKIYENSRFEIYRVQWQVFENIHGEGLLLEPKQDIKGRIVVIPDADQNPELLTGIEKGLKNHEQYARQMAENGYQVIIPMIINRSNEYSSNERLGLYTNQPHREWIYRQAYTFGRHVIGFEIQKIRAAVSWFSQENTCHKLPIGITGWGEGGLLAFYTAAIDTRIDATLVSGCFGKREDLWQEPIYRNVFGLLKKFGDAEITQLIAPRHLLVEYSDVPDIGQIPEIKVEKYSLKYESAAPGILETPIFFEVSSEIERAKNLMKEYDHFLTFHHRGGDFLEPMDLGTINDFIRKLCPDCEAIGLYDGVSPKDNRDSFLSGRQKRQVKEMEEFCQSLIQRSIRVREIGFWNTLTDIESPDEWDRRVESFREVFHKEVMGKIPVDDFQGQVTSRKILEKDRWNGYEVAIDVNSDIFQWGYLLIPKDLKRGEQRSVVVVQHGGSGLPYDVIDPDNKTYKAIAVQLVEKGYIVFAPHFPWREGDEYRSLGRKANLLGLSAFSVIIAQHSALLKWLSQQSWINSDRIGIYGLSWGGKVAMRVPGVLKGYRFSVCSGDFNEWIWKNATTDFWSSYLYVGEYEMFDFNLGRTFDYAEMAAFIAPRMFMVERGHRDGVGIDEQVAFEYAKVRRLYDEFGISDRTEIDYFNGGHEINGDGTMKFIQKHFPVLSNRER